MIKKRTISIKKLISTVGVVTLLSLTANTNAAQTCFAYSGAIENWQVPAGVTTVTAEAWGAQGGNSTHSAVVAGGLGAYMKGDVSVTPGDQLKILVGGQGESLAVGGGGGGSYLSTSTDTPLLVAGGGGGASTQNAGVHAVTGTAGTADSNAIVAGGTAGNGGAVCGLNRNDGGGGGGFLTDGATANSGGFTNGGFGGIAFVNGGAIAPGGRLDGACSADPAGGFGGGGSATCNTVGGGGGGGYSGGAGGSHVDCGAGTRAGGGGGGSFNSGTSQTNTAATQSGNGEICVTYDDSYTVGGTISGLTGSITLQNNLGDDLIVNADGSFTFPTPVVDGNTYSVTILQQPIGLFCSITSGGSGTSTTDINNIVISCLSTAPVPTVSIWGLGILISLMGIFGFSRRRKM